MRRAESIERVQQANEQALKQAEDVALGTASSSTELTKDILDRHGPGSDIVYDDAPASIHESHSMKSVSELAEAIYCARCGVWTSGKALKTLTNPCSGVVAEACIFQHRLLELGIIPRPGARIPAHARKRQRRAPSIGSPP